MGDSALLPIIAGEAKDYDGSVRVEGALLYMRQFVAAADTTVPQLLLSLVAPPIRAAGAELVLADTIVRWDEVGEYAEEAAWNAACRTVVGQPYAALAKSSIAQP